MAEPICQTNLNCREEIWATLKSTATPQMNNKLDAPFLEVELKTSLWSLSKASCPREDGLSMIFFQKYWNIIGIWLPKVCNEIFDKGRMPVDMTVALIYMIPKGEKQ